MSTEATTAPVQAGRRLTIAQLAALGVVVVLFVAGVGYLGYERFLARPALGPFTGAPVQVKRGSVVSTVNATGSVVSTRQSRLTMQSAGRIKEIPVKLGDQVAAGTVLAKLDTAPLELKLAQAQSTLRAAKIKLDQLKTGARPEEIAAAEAAVKSAQAKLDDLQAGSLPQEIAQAQAAVDAAAANLRSAQGRLGDTVGGPTAPDLQGAQAALDTAASSVQAAQARLDLLKQGPTAADVAAAEQTVATAQSALQKAESDLSKTKQGALPEEIRAAELAVDQAKNALWSQQVNRDATCGRDHGPSCTAAQAQVAAAESTVQQAQTKLDALRAKPDPRDVQTAQAALDGARETLRSAQARLDQLKAGPTQQDLAQAQAALDGAQGTYRAAQAKLDALRAGAKPGEAQSAQGGVDAAQANFQAAQAKLDALKAGPKAGEVVAAQGALVQAQTALAIKKSPATPQDLQLAEEQVKQADIAVQAAQLDVDNATLVAPYEGVVGQIAANVGEQVVAGTALMTLVDPKAVRVDVNVDETDVAKIAVGKPALIALDAQPARTFNGKVIGIAPNATVQQGVPTYTVSVSVDDADAAAPLTPGLTANVSVVLAQKDGALLVPNRAIRRQGGGQAVDVLLGGHAETRPVKTGITSDQMTEVLDGVAEGDTVFLPVTAAPLTRVGGVTK